MQRLYFIIIIYKKIQKCQKITLACVKRVKWKKQ